jgi:hypothetical protein
MDEKKSVFKEFFRLVTIAFTCAVLTMSLVGWFLGDDAREIAYIFALGSAGLPYQVIFALILFSAINSGLALLIPIIFKRLMVLWQLIITMFVCLVANGIIIAAFRWIPMDSLEAWLWFAGTFVGMFAIVATAMIIITKRADKQYEKQLSEYKAKQKNEEGNP